MLLTCVICSPVFDLPCFNFVVLSFFSFKFVYFNFKAASHLSVFAQQVSLLCFGGCKHETFPCGAPGALVLACSHLVLVWRICVCKYEACLLTVMFSVLVLGGACDSVVLRLRSQAVRGGLLTRKFCSQSAIEHQVVAKNLEQCCSRLGGW